METAKTSVSTTRGVAKHATAASNARACLRDTRRPILRVLAHSVATHVPSRGQPNSEGAGLA
jgi:hypothetical protein